MVKDNLTRRRFCRHVIAVLTAPAMLVGCDPGTLYLVLSWVVMIATTGAVVCKAAEAYWQAESARLDAEKKTLEVDGTKDGRKAKGSVKLTPEQVTAIKKSGKVYVEFTDGKKIELKIK